MLKRLTLGVQSRQLVNQVDDEPVWLWRPVIIPRLDGHAGLAGHALFGLLGREIAEGRVHAVSVMVALDVSEQRLSGCRPGCPSALMDKFDLQGVEEAVHWGVIVAISVAAHRWRRADLVEMVNMDTGCVLRTTVGVADETGRWSLPLGRPHINGS